MGGDHRTLPKNLSGRRQGDGQTGVFRPRHSTTGAERGGRARALGIDAVRRQETRRALHAHLPPVQTGVEDRPRPYFVESVERISESIKATAPTFNQAQEVFYSMLSTSGKYHNASSDAGFRFPTSVTHL